MPGTEGEGLNRGDRVGIRTASGDKGCGWGLAIGRGFWRWDGGGHVKSKGYGQGN